MANKEKVPRVEKDMLLGEVVQRYPAAAQVMLEYGLHCVGCFANQFDTVEIGAKVHGMTDEEIDKMVEEINAAISTDSTVSEDGEVRSSAPSPVRRGQGLPSEALAKEG